jgi:hypothetical protein
VFTISLLNTTTLSRLAWGGLGAPWTYPGHTLDIPWTYPGTIDHPQTPFFNQASLSEQHSRDYNADLFVDNRLIIELKAAKAVADEHVAQLLGYLRASRIEHGLLIKFGAPKIEIRKFALS